MNHTKIRKLEIQDLPQILTILSQDSLRGYNGLLAHSEKPWITHFIEDENCFAFGLSDDNNLISVILSERLTFGGCIIWYFATLKDKQGLGWGSQLLNYFETYVKDSGVEWIFLNATDNSLKFYKDRNYETSKYSGVFEHVKNL